MRYLLIPLAIVLILLLVLVVQVLMARSGVETFTGNPSGEEETFGQTGSTQPPLRLLVLGDSTAAGQGADYRTGIAVGAAEYLAGGDRQVILKNLAVSGATTPEIVSDQLPRRDGFVPDVVLVSSGANDTTKLVTGSTVARSIEQLVTELRQANEDVLIYFTGVPAMGAVPRLAQPLRWLVGQRASALDRRFDDAEKSLSIRHIDIAAKTGPTFQADPSLFAADRYHPNERGYAVWNAAIRESLAPLVNGR